MVDQRKWYGGDVIPQYRVVPGAWPWLMQALRSEADTELHMVTWGFLPAAQEPIDGARPVTEVGIEKARSGRYLRHMWESGRAILPVEGWFEMVDGDPWFVRLVSGAPMFIAVITNAIGQHPKPQGAGFVIVVSSLASGFANTRQRRPIGLPADKALRWLSPSTSADEAERLLQTSSLDDVFFTFHRVDKSIYAGATNDRRSIAPHPSPSNVGTG